MSKMAPCPGCGRQVAGRTRVQKLHGGGKHRARHKCPHGRWCIAGKWHAGQGWNPGSRQHRMSCEECCNAAQQAERERRARMERASRAMSVGAHLRRSAEHDRRVFGWGA